MFTLNSSHYDLARFSRSTCRAFLTPQMMSVSRRILSNQSLNNLSQFFFHTNSCLSFLYLNQRSFFLRFSRIRVFLHQFFPIRSTSSNTVAAVLQTESEKKNRDMKTRNVCTITTVHFSALFLSLSPLLSLSLFLF